MEAVNDFVKTAPTFIAKVQVMMTDSDRLFFLHAIIGCGPFPAELVCRSLSDAFSRPALSSEVLFSRPQRTETRDMEFNTFFS